MTSQPGATRRTLLLSVLAGVVVVLGYALVLHLVDGDWPWGRAALLGAVVPTVQVLSSAFRWGGAASGRRSRRAVARSTTTCPGGASR